METIAFYEALLRAGPSAILAVDENMDVKVINTAAERILDTAAGNIVGRRLKDCSLISQASLADIATMLKEASDQTITGYLCGEERPGAVVFHSRRLTDTAGRTQGAVLILEPPGQRREAERIINDEKLELIRHMSLGIAHHVRNSLTAVRGFIQIMKERTGGEPVAGFTEFSSIALKELDRVNEVIGNLLHLASVPETKKEAVNVKTLLENVYSFIRGKAALSGVLVVKEFSSDLPRPCVDVVQMIHVLLNILDNAIRSMPDGGRLVLRSYVIQEENRICIEINDTGLGIPPENIKNIFNPFFSTREDGSGFGLALANKIIHDHGGEILVASKEGVGSTFFIYLPFKTLVEKYAE